MKPTVGRIVHVYDKVNKTMLAAIISGVEKKPALDTEKEKYDSEENSYCVRLHVFTRYGVDPRPNVTFDTSATQDQDDHWSWPVREA
jgi:hypothetical protein